MSQSEWIATIRIETWNVSGSRRPGAGFSELVMEAGGLMFTKSEWERSVSPASLRYGKTHDGRITSHGSVMQGFVYPASENPSDWNQW